MKVIKEFLMGEYEENIFESVNGIGRKLKNRDKKNNERMKKQNGLTKIDGEYVPTSITKKGTKAISGFLNKNSKKRKMKKQAS